MELIEYRGKQYPALQSHGYASQYAFSFADKFLSGAGLDIGCMKLRWSYPGATPIDIAFDDGYDAMKLPENKYGWDYIFSSHCLEHLTDYVGALDYWNEVLKPGGILFLYLPNMDYQHYWQPENNRKHLHYINPAIIKSYFNNRDIWKNVIVTEGYDLNGSFYAIAEKG